MKQRYYLTLGEFADKIRKSSPEKALEIFDLYLTPSEIEMIAIRWEVLRLTRLGYPYHFIAKDLGISTATISRWATRELEQRRQRIKYQTPPPKRWGG